MKPDYCIHFSGIQNESCSANHKYIDFARPLNQSEIDRHNENYTYPPREKTAIVKRIPCKKENNVIGCPDYCLPTKAQLDQFEVKLNKIVGDFLESMSVVRPAIVEDIKRKNALNLSVSGRIKCPICAGQVFYKYAGSRNKHIQAICSTPECVQWME